MSIWRDTKYPFDWWYLFILTRCSIQTGLKSSQMTHEFHMMRPRLTSCLIYFITTLGFPLLLFTSTSTRIFYCTTVYWIQRLLNLSQSGLRLTSSSTNITNTKIPTRVKKRWLTMQAVDTHPYSFFVRTSTWSNNPHQNNQRAGFWANSPPE